MSAPDTAEWHEILSVLADDLASRSKRRPDQESNLYQQAWSEFGDRLRALGGMLGWKLGVRADDVDDAIQTWLLRLQDPRELGRLLSVQHPRAYLYVSLRNALLDRQRQEQRAQQLQQRLLAFANLFIPGELDARIERLRLALDKLNDQDRHLIELAYYEDRSLREIAAELKITYSAAAVRLSRLVARLRAAM